MGKPSTDSESSSLSHFSHPHPLQLLNHQSLQSLTLVSCSACNLEASDQSVYGCIACNYFLHQKCSQLPKQITHPFDQQHVFSLLAKPKYSEGIFSCDACGKQGHGFCYHCETCGKDLHILCASLPMALTHHSHHHQLSLTFSPPYPSKSFHCDVCKYAGSNNWLYRCNSCEFDVHLSCVTTISSASRTRSALPTPSPSPAPFTTPGVHGPVWPNGVGQSQSQVMGMPYTASPPLMTTMPPNNFMNMVAQQQAFVQQQAMIQAQQSFARQQAMIHQAQAMMQQQAFMPQQGLAQPQGNMLMSSFVGGVASGASQAATEALIQGLLGGNGGNGAGGVSFVRFGGTDASSYDGGYGGIDGSGSGGGSY